MGGIQSQQPAPPIAIVLKLGSFGAAYKGQMELYLRWLDRYERLPGEGPPIGQILAARRTRSRLSCYRSTGARSGWRSIWWSCRQGRCWRAKLHEANRLARGQSERGIES